MDFIEARTPPGYVPPLLMPALGFASGIGAARLFIFYPYTVSVSVIAGLTLIRVIKKPSVSHIGILTVSLAAGFGAFYIYGPGAPSYASELTRDGRASFLGEVVRPPEHREGYTVVTMKPVVPKNALERDYYRRAGRIRLTLDNAAGIGYGDVLRCDVRLKPPRGFMVPGVFDYGEYAKLGGMDAVGSAGRGSVSVVSSAKGGMLRSIYDFRERLMRTATASLSPDAGAIFGAIILGDQGAVTPQMRDEFQRSGTTHILSVSGSHVALLAAVVYLIIGYLPLYLLPERLALRLTMRIDIRKLAAGVAIPSMVMYCLLAGSEPPTVRSVVMLGVYLGSVLIGRHKQVINTLSLAALVLLVPDPAALFDISFQLSFLSVLFMALAARYARSFFEQGWLRGRAFVSNLLLGGLMSIAAIAGTYPLVAGQFGTFSYVALPANLVVLPLAGFLAVPVGLLSALLQFITGSHTLPLAALNEYAIDAFYSAVRLFAAVPGAGSHPPAPGPLFTVLYYAGLLTLLLAGRRGLRYAGGAAFVTAVALSAVLPSIIRPGGMRVTFIDVRQGDSALVEFPDGPAMLIDTGGSIGGVDPGRNAVAPYLRNLGIRNIDYLVLSHPAYDHIGGAEYLAVNFPVYQVWESYPNPGSQSYISLSERLDEMEIERHFIPAAGEIKIGGATVQVLSHGSRGPMEESSENNRSLVLRIKYGDVSFLFTGDIESAGQNALVMNEPGLPLRSTVLKVPHHGSSDADSFPFRQAVAPEVAVVSSGARRMFGHPAASVVKGLRDAGATVYGTNPDGSVIITTDGHGLSVETASGLRPVPANGWNEEYDNFGRLAKRLSLI